MFKKKKRIFILEDEVALAKALSIKLESEGYEVVHSEDGEHALETLTENDFDLAILDLVTPKVDGFGVLTHLKQLGKQMPVFVVSNLSSKEDMEKALALGATKYYIKSNISLGSIAQEAKEVLEQ